MTRTLVPLLLLLATAVAPAAARANGRFPQAQHLIGGPGAASGHLALRTTFGVITSADRGRSWRYLCEDVLGVSGRTIWDAPIALAADATLFVGLPDGLSRVTDGCSTVRVPEIAQSFTADLTTTGDGSTLYWLGSDGPSTNRVHASTDGGRTFAARGSVREGVLLETIEASDLMPGRVYVTGVQLEPRRFFLYRSDDGARSFREIPIGTPGMRGAYLAGLDPRSADGVWIRAPLAPDEKGVEGTALLHSRDAGERFEIVAQTRGPMLGFAISRADSSVWYGGPDDGLWRSDNGGADFDRIGALPVSCLRWHDGALYACASYQRTGWAVGRSMDRGLRFDPLLRFEDLAGPPVCPATTLGGQLCPGRWSVLRRLYFSSDAGTPPRDTGTVPADPPAPPPSSGSGCSCATPRDRGSPGWSAVPVMWTLNRARRRRRRA